MRPRIAQTEQASTISVIRLKVGFILDDKSLRSMINGFRNMIEDAINLGVIKIIFSTHLIIILSL
jgi:hypothetical protein